MDWTPTAATGATLKTLTKKEREYLRNNKGCFCCRQINVDHIARNCPGASVPMQAAGIPRDDSSENGEL
jgi:hypothetical protein